MDGHRRRGIVASVVLATMVALATVAGASPRASRAPAACAETVKHTIIDLLAGNRSYLAYALGYRIDEASGNESGRCDLPRFDQKSEYLYVRTRSGKTVKLGMAPAYLSGDRAALVGSTLYDDTVNFDDPSYRSVVYWWDLRHHTAGHFRVPRGYGFATAGPHGAILERRGSLVERSRSGKLTSLGHPFATTRFVDAIATHHGLVVLGDSGARYMTFSAPAHFRVLDLQGPQMQCPTLSRRALGCYNVADDDSGLTSQLDEIVPLSGAAPTVDPTGGGRPPALAGRSTLVYLANDGIRSFSRTEPHPQRGAKSLGESEDAGVTEFGTDVFGDLHREWLPVVSAFGGAVLVNTQRTRVVLAHDATHTQLLFRVPHHDHQPA